MKLNFCIEAVLTCLALLATVWFVDEFDSCSAALVFSALVNTQMAVLD